MPSVDLSSCRLAPAVHELVRYPVCHLWLLKQQAAPVLAELVQAEALLSLQEPQVRK